MKIGVVKLSISNNVSEKILNNNIKGHKPPLLTLSSKKSHNGTSYISSLIKEKQLKEKQLEKLKNEQQKHIALLEKAISNIQNNINKLDVKSYYDKCLKDLNATTNLNKDDKMSKTTDNLNKHSKQIKSTTNLDKNIIESKLTDNLNKTNKILKEKEKLNKNSKELKSSNSFKKNNNTLKAKGNLNWSTKDLNSITNLINSGKIKVFSKSPQFLELTKLLNKYTSELKEYKDTSTQKIKDLNDQIKSLQQKIIEKSKNSKKIVDLYI